MLQNIRDRAQGWFATVVFGLLLIPFALWGVNWYVRERSEVVVAKVNGTKIRLQEYERAYQEQRRYLQSLLGAAAQLDGKDLKQQTIDKLVSDRLLDTATQRQGLRIGDGDLVGAIQLFPAFQKDGRFVPQLYENRLRELGLSPTGFEERMRVDLATEQLHQGISDTNFVTQAAVELVEKLKGQRRDVVYATVAAEPLKSQVTPTEAEIEDYYRRNSARFMSPEMVKLAYVELSADELAKGVAVDEQALRDYYETHKATFSTPEERSANHILVHVKKDATPEQVEAARKLAEGYLNEAKAGKSFEEIAMQKSDDVGSKAEGGKTGFFPRGVMAKEFEDAAFSMQPGELRGPIRTEFGWHVIRLNEIKPATTKTFEEARADVEAAVRKEQAEKMYFDEADQLSTLTYENSDSLEPAAKALNLKVKETDFVTRTGGEGLFANPKVVEAAFSSEVITERLNSQPIEIGPTHALVLRLVEHKPSTLRPLTDVRTEVVALVTAELAKRKAEERGKALLERLAKGEDREALARSGQLTWTEVKGATREDDTKLSRAVGRLAFRIPYTTQGEARYDGVSLGTGDYVIVGVTGIGEPDLSKPDEDKRKAEREVLFANYANNDWRDYLAELKAGAKISTHTDRL
ncbi:MAG: SurA N-terminal domain-containing protein [Gammaproteobacteria bacterium]|nr:SurA N-terminal domain-containing protein [Gammaproteobacteria bacterium]